MKQLISFLGGIHFAIGLIVAAAFFVGWGTFLESQTGSHRFAARYTYQNPVFLSLLALFFINILFAALRRWPFQWRHCPFLLTHLGLLMLIAGTFIKATVGLQGIMRLAEGTESRTVYFPESYQVRIERRDGQVGTYDPRRGKSPFPGLEIQLVDYQNNATPVFESWIKGDQVAIAGLPKVSLQGLEKPVALAQIFPPPNPPCQLFACNVKECVEVAEEIYRSQLQVRLFNQQTDRLLYDGCFHQQIEWGKDGAELKVHFGEEPHLSYRSSQHEIIVPLSGTKALLPQDIKTAYLGSSPLAIDLKRPPALLLLQDEKRGVVLFLFDAFGRVFKEVFPADRWNSLIAYDGGFAGYAAQAKVPYFSEDRQQTMQWFFAHLKNELQTTEYGRLPPPLQLLYRACQKAEADFPAVCLDWLQKWDKSHSWLFPEKEILPDSLNEIFALIDWQAIPAGYRNACGALCAIFHRLEPRLQMGDPPQQLLEEIGWPLPLPVEEDPYRLLTAITQQLFTVADEMGESDREESPARLFSALLRAYEIHLSTIPLQLPMPQMLLLETPLTLSHQKKPPSAKLEDNSPFLTLRLREGIKNELVPLSYDSSAIGLKWGGLEGQYRLRFQSAFREIPYILRLRSARTISYPHSDQPYSYEAELLVRDLRSGQEKEIVLSMNRVYETDDGYRFYLSHASSNPKGEWQQVQLAVNRDPVRHWLTYPGGIFVALGIIGLFWARKMSFLTFPVSLRSPASCYLPRFSPRQ